MITVFGMHTKIRRLLRIQLIDVAIETSLLKTVIISLHYLQLHRNPPSSISSPRLCFLETAHLDLNIMRPDKPLLVEIPLFTRILKLDLQHASAQPNP